MSINWKKRRAKVTVTDETLERCRAYSALVISLMTGITDQSLRLDIADTAERDLRLYKLPYKVIRTKD